MMMLEEYIDHLIAGEDESCMAAAREIATDLPGLHRLYVETIQPSQYRVGEIWESGKISVAAEHLATATNSYVATNCYAPLARVSSGGPKAMVACTPEEMHELGPRLLSDLLECDGWDVDFYGTSMPLRDLIGAIRERRPRFVGLSAALVMHLGSVRRTITTIHEALGPETPQIVVGGNAFRGGDDLWKKVGADLYAADASEAVTLLRDLRD
jgi:methanogenic corrinoid protein MtbC1